MGQNAETARKGLIRETETAITRYEEIRKTEIIEKLIETNDISLRGVKRPGYHGRDQARQNYIFNIERLENNLIEDIELTEKTRMDKENTSDPILKAEHEKAYADKMREILIGRIYNYVRDNPTYTSSSSVSSQQKERIKKRDRNICKICEKPEKPKDKDFILVVDHVYPVTLGGSNDDINLISAHDKCNREKTSRSNFYMKKGKDILIRNIGEFVDSTLLIIDFKSWLDAVNDGRKKLRIHKASDST